jgi:hypothetical protein
MDGPYANADHSNIVSGPSARRRGSHISKHVKVLERTSIWSWVPTESGTKTNCAGEGHQQFTRPDQCWITVRQMWRLLSKDQPLLSSKRRPHFQTPKCSWNEQKFGHESQRGPETKNSCADEGQQKFTAMPYFQELEGIHRGHTDSNLIS